MTKLARLPLLDRTTVQEPGGGRRKPRLRTRYYAFLSYSHKDKELADWLHSELEKFRVPNALAGRLTANGVIPRRLTPIFRDQQDLSAGDDLALEIEAALAASQFLVILCSPTAAKSRWTNLEIESFKRTRPEGCVLAAVAAGEPFASDIPGREDEECFPPALRYKYDRRGHRTNKRAEPLAADFREGGGGRRLAFLKLVAGMLGVGLDELVQRETTRRQRRLAMLAAASLAGMAVTSTLAVTAIKARDAAREQRREAEGLIGFMVGDLKDKLEPIGRLDALDGVGARVLAYYQKEGTADLSDASLSQRSRALSLMGQVAYARGDLDGSLRLYREAMTGTGEAIRRNPSDPQAYYDHAQNLFYIGQIAHQRGDFRTAEADMREYQRLADRMIALGPDNMKWRMEKQYADFNLAVALYDQRRFSEAAALFLQCLTTMQAIATADPNNLDYQQEVAEGLTWLADAERSLGNYRQAIAARQRDVLVIERLFAETGSVDYQQRLVPAHRNLGALYAEQGQNDLAVQELRAAVAQADALVPKEPANSVSQEYSYSARLYLAYQLLHSGKTDEAGTLINAGCATVAKLLQRKDPKPQWRSGLGWCLATKAQLALAEGSKADALKFAQASVSARRPVHTGDPVADAYDLASRYLLLGSAQHELGNEEAARSAWTAALSQLPGGVADPRQMAIRLAILEKLGRTDEAQPLRGRLQAMGFKGTVL